MPFNHYTIGIMFLFEVFWREARSYMEMGFETRMKTRMETRTEVKKEL